MSEAPRLYRIATIGSPRGLRGEVRLTLHTDDPQGRLAPGSRVFTDPDIGPITVATLAQRNGTWYVSFEEFPDRTAIEPLVHTRLLAEGTIEDDAWYPDQLAGLPVLRTSGEQIGTVIGIENYPAHDMLVIRETGGERTLVPLVHEIVPEIDVEGGRVVVDPPRGLLAADGDDE